MERKLFCEINSFTYFLSVKKERIKRHIKNLFTTNRFAKEKGTPLPVLICKHNSLIRRKLGNVDMQLQENKAINLSLSAPKINGLLIKPYETFSFWKIVGNCTKSKGYKEGLTITFDKPTKGIGGGMCQLTNLIHWLTLHSPLEILEYHHHDGFDLFPDSGRQVPFGCGTSILYNYLDYRIKNNTDVIFQFIVYVTPTHLCGELRASKDVKCKYHIIEEEMHFVKVEGSFYRRNTIIRTVIDKQTGIEIERELIKENNAKVMYDEDFINRRFIRTL